MFAIKIINQEGFVLQENQGDHKASVFYPHAYQEGDFIQISSDHVPGFAWVQVDDVLGEALVYLTEKEFTYGVPFGEKCNCYSPKAFSGEAHLVKIRTATLIETKTYRNIALNRIDQTNVSGCFPHAVANVQTRGESVFAAKNAIDGVTENTSHGNWPYQSWGINCHDDAQIEIQFGREVEVDKLVIVTRADFPHDNWWKQVSVTFSDESTFDWQLEKTGESQEITFSPKRTSSIRLSHLIKSTDPSPFPALTQLEVYGV